MSKGAWLTQPTNQALTGNLAAAAALGLLFDGGWRLRHTTLVAPLGWGVVAAAMLILADWVENPFVEYAAAVLLIAPTLALLGAKRPQNGAWQFIVLTLVCVLLLPAFQGLAFGDARPHVHMLFRWLIAAHIFIGAVNYLPTRYAGPAVVFATAQSFLALRFLPGVDVGKHSLVHAAPVLAGSVGLFIALLWVKLSSQSSSRVPAGLERVWRDFRDAYGLVWGLRIAERLNASAQKHGWPVEFTWGGMLLRDSAAALDAETQHRVERELRSHLRRFVSHAWIVARMPETTNAGTAP